MTEYPDEPLVNCNADKPSSDQAAATALASLRVRIYEGRCVSVDGVGMFILISCHSVTDDESAKSNGTRNAMSSITVPLTSGTLQPTT